ncbi:MAG: prolipoprotein diacylglyceryl transferase [Bacteriovoracaceae bacterium]
MKWNADPEIFRIGFFALRYYSLMFVLGFVLMGYYVENLFKRYKKDPLLVSSLTTHIIIGMLLGSRLVHCFFYDPDYYLSNPIDIFKVWEGGLASHGGYLGVLIAVGLFMKKNKDLTFYWIMDLIVGPCLFVGGLIRIGNFFNSEIVGYPTNLPWGIIFERVDQLPRHPAQLYEAIGYFSISFILATMVNKKFLDWKRGTILCAAIIISFTFRFFIEFVKDEQSTLTTTWPINMGQVLSIVFVVFGFLLLRKIQKATNGPTNSSNQQKKAKV